MRETINMQIVQGGDGALRCLNVPALAFLIWLPAWAIWKGLGRDRR